MKPRLPSTSRGSLGFAATILLGCVNAATISAVPDGGAPPVDRVAGTDAGTTDVTPVSDVAPVVDLGGPTRDEGPARVDVGVVDVVPVDRPVRDAVPFNDAVPFDNGVATPSSVPTCGGVRCAAGESCCYGTGRCYDPATPAACPVPPRTTDPRACSSDAQCAATELCAASSASGLCLGVGTCEPRRELTSCGGGTEVCGCDGQYWPSACAASLAGVRGRWRAPCGQQVFPSLGNVHECVVPEGCATGYRCDLAMGRCVATHPIFACGNDAHCPSGQFCCLNTGLCVSSSDRDLCRTFPGEGFLGCRTNADCALLQAYQGLGALYCAGDGCGTVGSCERVPSGCSGELAPVCGCDGRSYTSACSAGAARTRVAHTGACP